VTVSQNKDLSSLVEIEKHPFNKRMGEKQPPEIFAKKVD